MNAYEIPGLKFSAVAGGDIALRSFVTINADGNAIQAVSGTGVVGAAFNQNTVGESVEIGDGLVMVSAGAAFTAGSYVTSDANGKAILAEGEAVVVGIAFTTGVAGGLATIKIN